MKIKSIILPLFAVFALAVSPAFANGSGFRQLNIAKDPFDEQNPVDKAIDGFFGQKNESTFGVISQRRTGVHPFVAAFPYDDLSAALFYHCTQRDFDGLFGKQSTFHGTMGIAMNTEVLDGYGGMYVKPSMFVKIDDGKQLQLPVSSGALDKSLDIFVQDLFGLRIGDLVGGAEMLIKIEWIGNTNSGETVIFKFPLSDDDAALIQETHKKCGNDKRSDEKSPDKKEVRKFKHNNKAE